MNWNDLAFQLGWDDYDLKSVIGLCRKAMLADSPEQSEVIDIHGLVPGAIVGVVKSSKGQNDGLAWRAVFVLYDGRFLFVKAGCDYTGWG